MRSQFHGECLGQADQGALGRGVGAHARHDLVAQARCHGRYRGRFAGTQQRQQLAYQDMRGCQVYRHQVIPCRQRDLGQGTARQYRIAAEEHECIDVPPGAPDLSDRLDDGLLFKRVKADVAGAGNAAVGADGLGQVQHGDVHAMGQRLGDEFASDAAAAAGDYHVRARFRTQPVVVMRHHHFSVGIPYFPGLMTPLGSSAFLMAAQASRSSGIICRMCRSW